PAKCDVEVLPLDIAGLPQPLAKAGQWHFRCARERAGKKSDHWYRRLLRVRRERPCGSRAAEKGDEFAPPHSITLSVRASSVGETSRPSDLAVIRLMTKSKSRSKRQDNDANPVRVYQQIAANVECIRAALEGVEGGRDILRAPDFQRRDLLA